MDTHTQHDPNNPINFNGIEAIICTLCAEDLTPEEIEANEDDPNPYCNLCFYSCCGDELNQDVRRCPTCKDLN